MMTHMIDKHIIKKVKILLRYAKENILFQIIQAKRKPIVISLLTWIADFRGLSVMALGNVNFCNT